MRLFVSLYVNIWENSSVLVAVLRVAIPIAIRVFCPPGIERQLIWRQTAIHAVRLRIVPTPTEFGIVAGTELRRFLGHLSSPFMSSAGRSFGQPWRAAVLGPNRRAEAGPIGLEAQAGKIAPQQA